MFMGFHCIPLYTKHKEKRTTHMNTHTHVYTLTEITTKILICEIDLFYSLQANRKS